MPISSSKIPVILLAFANDEAHSLRHLDEEQRVLGNLLKLLKLKRVCEVVLLTAATADDVIYAFQEYRSRICIFHYGGHSHTDKIFFKDTDSKKGTNAQNLAEFLALQQGLELIFLNSCLSLPQAKKYHNAGAKAVLATDQKIGDKTARRFAELFYRSLIGGANICEAYGEAQVAIELNGDLFSRGLDIEDSEGEFPWRLFPEDPEPWTLPMTAQKLTPIPSIDLDQEFIGREADIKRLKKVLATSSKVVLMNGLGGIGKTVLATAYMRQYGNLYDHLVWIDRGENLVEEIARNEDLADTLGIPFQDQEELNSRFRRILRKLRNLPGRNLLVLDNAQVEDTEKENYQNLSSLSDWEVLLTSRMQFRGFETMQLGTLEPEAAKELFRTYFKGPFKETKLEALLEEISYHTLTVELLAKLLDKLNNTLSIADLTISLQKKELNNPDLQEKIWTTHSKEERSVYLHLMKAFELTDMSPREKWLLKQFVVLPVERYAVFNLAEFVQEKPLVLNTLLNNLSKQGWLILHDDKTFSIHRLIQQVANYQLKITFSDLESLLQVMIRKLTHNPRENFVVSNMPWLKYAVAVEDYLENEQLEGVVKLQVNIAETYFHLGRYKFAMQYAEKAKILIQSLVDENSSKLIDPFSGFALALFGLKQYDDALIYSQKAQEILESAENPEKAKLALCYNITALVYSYRKDFDMAVEFNERAMKIRESDENGDILLLSTSYLNLALAYRDRKEIGKALFYNSKALEIRKLELSADHPNLALAYNSTGLSLCDDKDYAKAIEYFNHAIEIYEGGLLKYHPNLIKICLNLADAYRENGQLDQGLKVEAKAEAIRKERENEEW